MVYRASVCARNAENDRHNTPGYCLQQVRTWCGIPARYGTAALAWANTNDRHTDRRPPRGAPVFWTGGSHGYGHIALSLGDRNRDGTFLVRSTDVNGWGGIGTVDLGWFERHWGLHYAGWAWDLNEVRIPHVKGKDR